MNPSPVNSVETKRSTASIIGMVALVVLAIGGLNWALVGLFNFDLVATLFGQMSAPTRVVYVLVGLAAIYSLTLLPRLSSPTARA